MIQFRELQWEGHGGLQRALGITGRYDILKNHGENKYSLYFVPVWTHESRSLGDKFPNYLTAQKAAEKDHQQILSEWLVQSPQEEACK